jgi:hypothetical protein
MTISPGLGFVFFGEILSFATVAVALLAARDRR